MILELGGYQTAWILDLVYILKCWSSEGENRPMNQKHKNKLTKAFAFHIYNIVYHQWERMAVMDKGIHSYHVSLCNINPDCFQRN